MICLEVVPLLKGTKVIRFPIIDDNSSIESLSILDKFRAIFNQWSEETGRNEVVKYELEEEVVKVELTLFADCYDFIMKALSPIRDGKKKSVELRISSKFDPVLDRVLNTKIINNSYTYKILSRPKVPEGVNYVIHLILEVRCA